MYSLYILDHRKAILCILFEYNDIVQYLEFSSASSYIGMVNIKGWNIPCMYFVTLGVRPCLDNVTRTSPALFLHIILCVGHQLVIALNNKLRSSFLASSSAGDTWLHSRTKTCPNKGIK